MTTSPATAPASPTELRGIDPRSGAPLSPVPTTPVAEITTVVERARAAQSAWASLSFSERAKVLEKAARALLRDRHQGLSIVEEEIGKTPADALFTEGLGPLDSLKAWIRVIDSSPSGKISLNPLAFPKKDARIELVPRGVVGVIAPWNFPIAGLYRSVYPALLLGNAVVLKPSEFAPRSSGWFAATLNEFLPEGLLGVVFGSGDVGAALVESGIDACVFTGSSAVGRRVEQRCQELGIAVSAEMGGNDAAIVLEDAALPRTVAGLTQWALQNAGQACGAVEVVYAEERIVEALGNRLADAFARLRPPAYPGESGSYAPLAHQKQLDVVTAQLEDARARGARVVGGKIDGLWVEPTVLLGCNDEMSVVKEETFGPLLPIVTVDGAADAVRRINRGRYGLTASIWTQDVARAERIARDLDVGVVTVNNHAFTGAIADLPWSGRRDSGRGIANSAWSLLTFARPKTIVIDRASGPEPFWAPYDDDLLALGHLLADAQIGKFGSAVRIPFLLRKRVAQVKAFFGIE